MMKDLDIRLACFFEANRNHAIKPDDVVKKAQEYYDFVVSKPKTAAKCKGTKKTNS